MAYTYVIMYVSIISTHTHTYIYIYMYYIILHVIVVTWARVICLICMLKARGPQARGLRAYVHIRQIMSGHVTTNTCNTFTPQIKGICCGLKVMYHIPQLTRCATTSLVCYNSIGMCCNFPPECI